ncbi:hypothetical protein AC790_17755 [Pantoea sp. RIT-PI-b]|uniref:Ig-like domain-containing protein n=1 Tax=Pantoea sp. RIT-PI-b TaxID=1681195 RepID=UPI000676513A|nr:Ig-like domain-containing protein [Pantoea sp. RIT-PI-b]KNC07907.1 hypothetical protein AC790_17755 [Pantoea sp. RIT-PI-b]
MKINKLFDPIETVVVEFATGKIAFESREDARDPEEAGVVVHIIINDQHFSTIIEEDGNWHWTAPEDLPDGTYNAVMYNVDKGGLQSEDYTPLSIVVDSTPPDAPILHNLYDDVGGKVGSFDKGGTTDDKTPQLTGVAQKGSKVLLKNADGETIGSAVADKDSGEWVIIPTVELQDGTNSLTLTAVEKFAGQFRESAPSEAFVINVAPDADIGTLPPDTILINHAFDNAGTNTGILKNGALTDDDTPELRGFASAGSTVVIMYREVGSNNWAGSATATLTGQQWSWTPSAALSSGNYEFQASIGDTSSALFNLEIYGPDDYARSARIVSAYDDAGSATGSLGNGAYTDDLTPTLRGRAEANSQVLLRYTLLDGSEASVTVDVDAKGNWSWTPQDDLGIGRWEFFVQPVGETEWSDAFVVNITDADSFGATIDYAWDDVGDKGKRASGEPTDDTTPTLHGHGEPNAIIYLSAQHGADEATIYSVKVNANGEWNWTPQEGLELGAWAFKLQKEGSTEWGNAFDLNIIKPSYTEGLIDFENLDLRESFDFNTWYNINQDIRMATNGAHAKYHKNSEIDGSGGYLDFENTTVGFELDRTKLERKNLKLKEFSFEITNKLDKICKIEITSYLGDSRHIDIPIILGANEKRTISIHDFYTPDEIARLKITGFTIWSAWYQIDNISYSYIDSTIKSVQESNISSVDNFADEISAFALSSEDTILHISGKDQLIDLTVASANTDQVNTIDLTGTGDNTLKLDLAALLAHGEKDLFIDDGKTQLVVQGDEGDVVQLADILPEGSDVSEWVHQDGTVTVAGVEYNVYSHGDDAELLIQQGVKTELV